MEPIAGSTFPTSSIGKRLQRAPGKRNVLRDRTARFVGFCYSVRRHHSTELLNCTRLAPGSRACGVVWCGVVWCGVVRCDTLDYGTNCALHGRAALLTPAWRAPWAWRAPGRQVHSVRRRHALHGVRVGALPARGRAWHHLRGHDACRRLVRLTLAHETALGTTTASRAKRRGWG